MDESPVRDRIEQLVEEEERLWQAAGHGDISAEDHRRLESIRSELDRCWDALRRRRAGAPDAGSVDVVALDDAPEGRRDVEAGAGGGDLVARDAAARRSQQREAAPTAAEVAVAEREARGAATGDGRKA